MKNKNEEIQKLEEKFIQVMNNIHCYDGNLNEIFGNELLPLLKEYGNVEFEKGYDTGKREGQDIGFDDGYASGYSDARFEIVGG